MSLSPRLQEIAAILALGVLRLKQRQKESKERVDFNQRESVTVTHHS